jgi:hypothetical protein
MAQARGLHLRRAPEHLRLLLLRCLGLRHLHWESESYLCRSAELPDENALRHGIRLAGESLFLAVGHVTLLHSVAEFSGIELLVADFKSHSRPHSSFGRDNRVDDRIHAYSTKNRRVLRLG